MSDSRDHLSHFCTLTPTLSVKEYALDVTINKRELYLHKET